MAGKKEDNKPEQMGWDGRSAGTFWASSAGCPLASIDGRLIGFGFDAWPAGPVTASRLLAYSYRSLATRAAGSFLLRLSVGGYGVSSTSCPRRQLRPPACRRPTRPISSPRSAGTIRPHDLLAHGLRSCAVPIGRSREERRGQLHGTARRCRGLGENVPRDTRARSIYILSMPPAGMARTPPVC